MKQQRHRVRRVSSKSGYYVISNGLYMVPTAALEKAVRGGVDVLDGRNMKYMT